MRTLNHTTLVIDSSYGLTVGLVGSQPVELADSHLHVESLEPTLAKVCADAGIAPNDIDSLVVGIGPGPFTGLRTGIVSAKAIAFATGAQLYGQDILWPQAIWLAQQRSSEQAPDNWPSKAGHTVEHLTLSVNDARRRQLYFELIAPAASFEDRQVLLPMDIDYPDSIVSKVNSLVAERLAAQPDQTILVDVFGRGADKYQKSWAALSHLASVCDDSLLNHGRQGLETFAACALGQRVPQPVEPLYLRRPDVSTPNPQKSVVQG